MERSPQFSAGYEAYFKRPCVSNPYGEGSVAFNEWAAGFLEAQDDMRW